jgi:SHS family sialic acid transporter-like MFS transporter
MGHPSLTTTGRALVLATAFAGWLCAGNHLAITSLAMQSAALDLLGRTGQIDRPLYHAAQRGDRYEGFGEDRKLVARWFAWYQCAFLFGAAAGGLAFGRVGDRAGRAAGMGLSILTYSGLAAAASLAQAPWQLLVLWFLASMGVGGMWPNGVALLSEVWSELSRPLVAGVLGTSANVGIFAVASLASHVPITPDDWRWVLLVASAPIVLGLFVLLAVPESPLWLAARRRAAAGVAGWGIAEKTEDEAAEQIKTASALTAAPPPAVVSSFQPTPPNPESLISRNLLPITLLAIALATIPMIGAWGSANWMVPWAAEAGEAADPPNPYLKANVQQARALTGIVGSLLGGWIASSVGRRRSYCLVSLAALFCAQYVFWFLTPLDGTFLLWVSALGFFSGVYFGWLPLMLPELFPTEVRSTGAGVSFNFGRILTAVTIFVTGALMTLFDGDYARIGRVTSLVFLAGAVAVWAAPDTSRRGLSGRPPA